MVPRERELETKPVKVMLDALSPRRIARKVNQFRAHDTNQIGGAIARIV
jgi:hypothetical protein